MPSDNPSQNDEPPLQDFPAPRRGRPWIAWCVIVGVAGFVVWQHSQPGPQAKRAVGSRLLGAVADWQARYLVGAARTFPQQTSERFANAAPVDSGPIEQRLRNVVVAGEISGPKAAAQKLERLEKTLQKQHADAEVRKTAESLGRLYGDLVDDKPALPSLEPADRKRLTERLGWSGELALHPAGGEDAAGREALLAQARRTLIGSLAAFAAFGMLGLAGAGVLLTILVLLARPASRRLSAPTPRGGIYAETFALWFVLYLSLSYGAGRVAVEHNRYLLTAGVMLASLAALGWPVFRGIAWSVVREDIGLNFGRRPLVEILLGPVTYIVALPMLVIGLIMVVALMAIQQSMTGGAGGEAGQNLPSHPIVNWLLESDWREKLQLVFLASVMAPLMEETMFRGVLHRHLRDATSRFGYALSVLTSGLIVSFLFAVIHPQGWVATPVLMALAMAFTLAREWRGSLLPAMLAHGINNLLATCVLISLSP